MLLSSQVVMTNELTFYQKHQIGSVVYWKELLPKTDHLGFLEFYEIPLTGSQAASSRYLLIGHYDELDGDASYRMVVADFVDHSQMRCFFLGSSVLVIGFEDGKYSLGNSYVWHDALNSLDYPKYIKMSSGLPDTQVAENDLEVFEEGKLLYQAQGKMKLLAWQDAGGFEEEENAENFVPMYRPCFHY